MTTISSGIAVPHRHIPARVQAVRAWFAAERERRRVRREMRELAHLPNHLLRDIGLEHFGASRRPEIRAVWR